MHFFTQSSSSLNVNIQLLMKNMQYADDLDAAGFARQTKLLQQCHSTAMPHMILKICITRQIRQKATN